MRYNEQQLLTDLKKIALTEQEKVTVRNVLLTYVKEHPVRKDAQARLYSEGKEKEWRVLPFLAPFFVPSLPLAVMLMGVSVCWASAEAAPGNILYPFKINVLEELYMVTAWTASQRFNRLKQRLALRLQEAQELLNNQLLDPEMSALMEKHIAASLDKVLSFITYQEREGNFDATLRWGQEIETFVAHYRNLLVTLSQQVSAKSRLVPLVVCLRAHRDIEPAFMPRTDQSPRMAYEEVALMVQGKINTIEEILLKVQLNLDPTSIQNCKEEFERSKVMLAQAQDGLKNGMRKEAFALLQKNHHNLYILQATLQESTLAEELNWNKETLSTI